MPVDRGLCEADVTSPASRRPTAPQSLAALELRLIKWIVGTGIAVAAAVAGILRLLP